MTLEEMKEMLNSRPECRAMLKAMHGATAEDILETVKLLENLIEKKVNA